MAAIEVTRRIPAPPAAAFDTLTVAARYPEYTPIRRVDMEALGAGPDDGPGAIRALHVAGPPLRERVLEHVEAELFAFEVLSGAPGLRNYVATQTFSPDGDGTRVRYRIEFDPLVPGTGWLAGLPLRAAAETLFVLASREAPKRAAENPASAAVVGI